MYEQRWTPKETANQNAISTQQNKNFFWPLNISMDM